METNDTMQDSGGFEFNARVYQPDADPQAFFEIRRRRMLAFVVDYLVIALICAVASVAIFFAGILTLGLAWALFAVFVPLVAMGYLFFTMGSPKQATIGMELFALRIERLDGRYVDGWLAILHGVLFWVIHSAATPLLLIASLFSSRKRLIQDWLLGTQIVRSDTNT